MGREGGERGWEERVVREGGERGWGENIHVCSIIPRLSLNTDNEFVVESGTYIVQLYTLRHGERGKVLMVKVDIVGSITGCPAVWYMEDSVIQKYTSSGCSNAYSGH